MKVFFAVRVSMVNGMKRKPTKRVCAEVYVKIGLHDKRNPRMKHYRPMADSAVQVHTRHMHVMKYEHDI
jgi:hypothetical protein